MSFKRIFSPHVILQDQLLTSALIGIGFRFGGKKPEVSPNIEDALFYASIEGLKKSDYRLLSLFMDWLSLHSQMVNVDRLTQLVVGHQEARFWTFWGAIAQWQKPDPRWKKLAGIAGSQRQDLLEFGTDFLVSKHGEDERFLGTCLRVPKLTLRERKDDVLTPEELAAIHRSYYFRLIIGPTYRADMWAYLESSPNAESSDVARFAYGSFSTAWEVYIVVSPRVPI
jgi:hypothetical protein